MSGNTNQSCSSSDKQFVINFLTKQGQKHQQQIVSLEQQVDLLKKEKEKLSLRLTQLERLCSRKEELIEQLCKKLANTVPFIMSSVQFEFNKVTVQQGGIQFLQTIPNKIKDLLPLIEINQDFSNNQYYNGNMNFLAFSRDGRFIDRFVGINQKFIKGFLLAKSNLISTIILFCDQ